MKVPSVVSHVLFHLDLFVVVFRLHPCWLTRFSLDNKSFSFLLLLFWVGFHFLGLLTLTGAAGLYLTISPRLSCSLSLLRLCDGLFCFET